MYTLEAIKANLARRIGEAADAKVGLQEIVAPPKPDMGDLAYGCFRLAKERGKNPADVAREIAEKIAAGDQSVESVTAQGPYVNVKLHASDLCDRVTREMERMGDEYGRVRDGENKQIMLEYANLNTHKEFHVGHLRNILYGLSVSRLLKAAGWDALPVSYVNDMGSHVAKCLWLFVRKNSQAIEKPQIKKPRGKKAAAVEAVDPTEEQWIAKVMDELTVAWAQRMIGEVPTDQRTGKYLGELYAEASKLLDENEAWKTEVSLIMKKLEDHDKSWTYLWQETRRWSLQELSRYLQDFGATIVKQYLESDFVDQSKVIVEDLLKQGIAIQSQGAVIIDFDAYPDPEVQKQKLGVLILRKTDGTLIYATKDLPLARQKFVDYPKLDTSVIVTDVRQNLYFKQIFTVLKLMGYNKPLKHLGYEFVTLPEGAMASRKGNVVTLQDFMAQATEAAKREVVERHPDWNDGKIEHAAWCIAMGGVMFAILKQDPEKAIVFDMKKSLAFEGDTGPYVQYAVTRLGSIMDKSKVAFVPSSGRGKSSKLKDADLTLLKEEAEKRLCLRLAQLPEIISRSAASYKPSIIATWCLDAAADVGVFYRDVKVLEVEEGLKLARLRLIASTKIALTNALWCLGIPVPDAM